MFMTSKRGEEASSFSLVELVLLIFGVLSLLLILGVAFGGREFIVLLLGGQQVHCGNAADFQAVTKALSTLEEGKSVPAVFFSNSDCYVVSFNDQQYATREVSSMSQKTVGGPRVCLCKMESEGVCTVYKDCYRFSKVRTINQAQFYSRKFGENIFLQFTLKNDALAIDVLGKNAQAEGKNANV